MAELPPPPTPQKRGVFGYFNGRREIRVDRMRVQRNLYLAILERGDLKAAPNGGNPLAKGADGASGPLDEFFLRVEGGDLKALGELIEAARVALDMPAHDEAGEVVATEEDVRLALEKLWEALASYPPPPEPPPLEPRPQ